MQTSSPRRPLTLRPTTKPVEPQPTTRREYPERDFGIGYGRSSGYATTRRYVHAWNGQPRFRCL